MMKICIVRHGETEENLARILQGQLPGRLTALGRQQASALHESLPLASFDAVVSSDLQRVVDTVRLILGDSELPWEQNELFREIDWGSMTGMKIADVDTKHLAPDVETREMLYERAGRAAAFLRQRYADKTVMVVSHGLFLRSLEAQWRGIPLENLRSVSHLSNGEARWLVI